MSGDTLDTLAILYSGRWHAEYRATVENHDRHLVQPLVKAYKPRRVVIAMATTRSQWCSAHVRSSQPNALPLAEVDAALHEELRAAWSSSHTPVDIIGAAYEEPRPPHRAAKDLTLGVCNLSATFHRPYVMWDWLAQISNLARAEELLRQYGSSFQAYDAVGSRAVVVRSRMDVLFTRDVPVPSLAHRHIVYAETSSATETRLGAPHFKDFTYIFMSQRCLRGGVLNASHAVLTVPSERCGGCCPEEQNVLRLRAVGCHMHPLHDPSEGTLTLMLQSRSCHPPRLHANVSRML